MLAFCTTIKGRLPHLRRTLPRNLADNSRYPDLRFVLLDYGCDRELLDYLTTDTCCKSAIGSGRLVVYSLQDSGPFRMAFAKNVSHRCGLLEGADILVNLDADNFTGLDFANHVAAQFHYDSRSFLWARRVESGPDSQPRGCSGRLAVSAHAFLNTGGYDEKYSDYGPDDKDFNARLRRLGYTPREIPRCYLDIIPHGHGLRFREYPHVTDLTAYEEFQVVNECESTVVNYGEIGCGTVYRNMDFDHPIHLDPLPTRIFGIGLHKTATSSLHEALTHLGYDSAHWKSGNWARDIWHEMRSSGRSRTLERSYALCDLPIPAIYKELDTAYPGSKFILTIRSAANWLRSVRDHWSYDRNQFRWEWDVYPFSNLIHREVYGQSEFDANLFLARYWSHNTEVLWYFRHRREDLLVLDVDQGQGYKELCRFLDRPLPAVGYPRSYVTDRGDS